MKTGRRHELQTNELADWLGKHILQIRPYSKGLLGVVVVLAAAVFAMMFLSARYSGSRGSAWQEFYSAALERDVGELEKIAAEHEGSLVATWALQAAADGLLAEGAGLLHIDRSVASRQLGRARNAYQKVLERTDDDIIKPRALLGLAQCYEALGDATEAAKRYDQVMEGWPGTALAKVAAERKDFLQQPATREFLAWFDRQQPQVAGPLSSAAGGEVLDDSELSFPGADDLTVPEQQAPFDLLQPPTHGAAADDLPARAGGQATPEVAPAGDVPGQAAPAADSNSSPDELDAERPHEDSP